MALFKEITNNKGVVSRYFRISSVNMDTDSNELLITVKEYTDNNYREKEKSVEALQSSINIKQNYIIKLNENYKDNESEITEQNQEINSLLDSLNESFDKEYFTNINVYTFALEDINYSLSSCYTLLKTLDFFSDSKDV